METFFDRALAAARQLGASDVHLKPGLAPILRINGELRTLRDVPPLARDFLHSLAISLLNDRRRETLERVGDVTLALTTSGGARQRVHVFQQRGGLALTLRLIQPDVPALATLGLPEEINELLTPAPGLLLVAAGPSGGKTTTLASMLDDLGTRHALHVVTIEDPVELLLKDRRTVVVQREVGLDVPSTAAGIRATARMDADVIMIGELADRESAELALSAAENGRLVLAGLPGSGSAPGALARLIGLFPFEQQAMVRDRLAHAVRGVLSQRLVLAEKAKRRSAHAELLRGEVLRSALGTAAVEPKPSGD